MRKMKTKGFTLIELVVVMVLLGIFASMIGPSFLDFRRKKDLDYTVQSFQALLSEAFSSSRAYSKIYRVSVEGEPNNNVSTIYTYDYKSCCIGRGCEFSDSNRSTELCMNTEALVRAEDFLGTVKMVEPSNGFTVYFQPPHGDIAWNGNIGNNGILDVELANENGDSRLFKIYEKSGLIGN